MRSRKRGARSVEHLVRWNGQGLTGLELSETPLCFLEPKGLGVGVHLGVEARDQALRKPSALSRGELERLRLKITCRLRHTEKVADYLFTDAEECC
jgi:hypothetical protein